MIAILKKYLEAGHVVFNNPFITADESTGNVRDVKKEFINQMYNFSRITVTRMDADGSPITKIFHSGKAGGGNDDFVMALAIGLHNRTIFLNNDKYRHLH